MEEVWEAHFAYVHHAVLKVLPSNICTFNQCFIAPHNESRLLSFGFELTVSKCQLFHTALLLHRDAVKYREQCVLFAAEFCRRRIDRIALREKCRKVMMIWAMQRHEFCMRIENIIEKRVIERAESPPRCHPRSYYCRWRTTRK